MRSPAGLELLGLARIVGWPACATPWNTVSTKWGWSGVPNVQNAQIWMQCVAISAKSMTAHIGGSARVLLTLPRYSG
jgi:hypothetical protein